MFTTIIGILLHFEFIILRLYLAASSIQVRSAQRFAVLHLKTIAIAMLPKYQDN